ncbi:hypothetical protein VTJ04DRAFT_9837 [Mycothermus thermophilus]|uniref:uncharacterized protein n=1 Tax=Humicola insolens TaxID=85995 RepID=UPI003741F814
MATNPQAFYCLWRTDKVRERLFELLDKKDICAVRLANSACCNLVTKRLFLRTHLTFTANSFTKASRIEALSRIGHHIEHLTFYFPHSPATFLPPLIHPATGEEILFIYNPHASTTDSSVTAKYGSPELGEILTQQYPPVFHAATHVSSFISALSQMPNMRHLTIKTPGQDPRERYRRDVVDYALISLRIALERAPLTKLTRLTLAGVHPCAFNYLRHAPGFGAVPSASLRWRQIRKLYISVDSWDFYSSEPGLDHLKIIDDFIRTFAPQLVKFSFTWIGRRGPCPIALAGDPLFAPPRHTKKLFNEVTGPMSPLPAKPFRRPIIMPRLRHMAVRNAIMNADQLRGLVASHKATVREFDFENVALLRGGTWEEALAPLTEGENGEAWSHRSLAGPAGYTVPTLTRSNTTISAASTAVTSSIDDEYLPDSSAAAAAASRELFEVDLEGMLFGGVNDVDAFEAGVEEWARGVTAAAAEAARPSSRPGSAGGRSESVQVMLAPEVEEEARQASPKPARKLRRTHCRLGSKTQDQDENQKTSPAYVEQRSSEETLRSERRSGDSHRPHNSRSRHKHSRSDDASDRPSSSSRDSRRRHHHRHRHHHRRCRSEELPETDDFMPNVVGTDDESYQPPRTPPPSSQPKTMDPDTGISVPLLNPEPLPIMLQPTVYDPSAKFGPLLSSPEASDSPSSSSSPSSSPSRSYRSSPAGSDDDGLSPTQRSIEADLLAEAQEAAARSSALKRAKEAVITKLTREFSKRSKGGDDKSRSKESAAVIAGLSALNLSMNLPTSHYQNNNNANGLSCASSSSVAYRFKEGIFGRSLTSIAIAPDQRSLDSQTALVPLILSRT